MYESQTFDWRGTMDGLVQTLRDITHGQVPVVAEDRVKSKQDYPFITYSDVNPHGDQAFSIYKTNEVFDRTLSIDCWAESSGEASNICDDLATLLHDPRYRTELKKHGITFVGIQDYRRRSEAMSSFTNISNYGFDLTIRLHRRYTPDYPTIKEVGGLTNGRTSNSDS